MREPLEGVVGGIVERRDWVVYGPDERFARPVLTDLGTIILAGYAHRHPDHGDGTRVKTSRLVRVDGRLAFTLTGRCYHLGDLDPRYEIWLRHEAWVIDPEHLIVTVA